MKAVQGKILVTGGTGFVGKNLVEALSNKKNYVKCFAMKESETKFLEKMGVELVYEM